MHHLACHSRCMRHHRRDQNAVKHRHWYSSSLPFASLVSNALTAWLVPIDATANHICQACFAVISLGDIRILERAACSPLRDLWHSRSFFCARECDGILLSRLEHTHLSIIGDLDPGPHLMGIQLCLPVSLVLPLVHR